MVVVAVADTAAVQPSMAAVAGGVPSAVAVVVWPSAVAAAVWLSVAAVVAWLSVAAAVLASAAARSLNSVVAALHSGAQQSRPAPVNSAAGNAS